MNLKDRLIKNNIINTALEQQINATNASKASEFAEELNYLSTKMDNVIRSYTIFDAYKIYSAASTESEFASKWVSLQPNNALIINEKIKDYNRGDILIKTEDGGLIRVKSDNNGIYIPESINMNGSTLSITYSYTNSIPVEGEGKSVSINGVDFGDKSVSYNNIYTREEASTANINLFTKNNKDIIPIIKMYASNGELIECEIKYTISSHTMIFASGSIPNIVAKVVLR